MGLKNIRKLTDTGLISGFGSMYVDKG